MHVQPYTSHSKKSFLHSATSAGERIIKGTRQAEIKVEIFRLDKQNESRTKLVML
jgi:hypothetical protein